MTAKASGPGSSFAASIATRIADEGELDRQRRRDHERRLADAGEAVLTVPEASVVLRWITEAGWSVPSADDFAAEAPGPRRGYLLVQAAH